MRAPCSGCASSTAASVEVLSSPAVLHQNGIPWLRKHERCSRKRSCDCLRYSARSASESCFQAFPKRFISLMCSDFEAPFRTRQQFFMKRANGRQAFGAMPSATAFIRNVGFRLGLAFRTICRCSCAECLPLRRRVGFQAVAAMVSGKSR